MIAACLTADELGRGLGWDKVSGTGVHGVRGEGGHGGSDIEKPDSGRIASIMAQLRCFGERQNPEYRTSSEEYASGILCFLVGF